MEITGTILKSLPALQGEGKSGKWVKRSFVIQTMGPYPREVAIEVFNDKGDVLKSLKKGDAVRIPFELSSREHNGKFYTSVMAIKIEPMEESAVGAPKAQPRAQQRTERQEEPPYNDPTNGDDLPF